MEAAEWSMSSTPDYLVIGKRVCRHVSPVLTSLNCTDLMRYSGSADPTRTSSLASETTRSDIPSTRSSSGSHPGDKK